MVRKLVRVACGGLELEQQEIALREVRRVLPLHVDAHRVGRRASVLHLVRDRVEEVGPLLVAANTCWRDDEALSAEKGRGCVRHHGGVLLDEVLERCDTCGCQSHSSIEVDGRQVLVHVRRV